MNSTRTLRTQLRTRVTLGPVKKLPVSCKRLRRNASRNMYSNFSIVPCIKIFLFERKKILKQPFTELLLPVCPIEAGVGGQCGTPENKLDGLTSVVRLHVWSDTYDGRAQLFLYNLKKVPTLYKDIPSDLNTLNSLPGEGANHPS